MAASTGEATLIRSGWAVEEIGQRALCGCNTFRSPCAEVDHYRLVEQALSTFRASSAAGGNLQPVAETVHGVCSVVAGFVDLSIRNLVANTDIHSGLTFRCVSFAPRISLTRVIRNYFLGSGRASEDQQFTGSDRIYAHLSTLRDPEWRSLPRRQCPVCPPRRNEEANSLPESTAHRTTRSNSETLRRSLARRLQAKPQ